jgi:hypothetical protein
VAAVGLEHIISRVDLVKINESSKENIAPESVQEDGASWVPNDLSFFVVLILAR